MLTVRRSGIGTRRPAIPDGLDGRTAREKVMTWTTAELSPPQATAGHLRALGQRRSATCDGQSSLARPMITCWISLVASKIVKIVD